MRTRTYSRDLEGKNDRVTGEEYGGLIGSDARNLKSPRGKSN
jgi:hypothetical protein